jgi:hypothetical protein
MAALSCTEAISKWGDDIGNYDGPRLVHLKMKAWGKAIQGDIMPIRQVAI